MSRRRSMLAPAGFTLVLVAALSTQSTRDTRAEDECITRPNAPAPQGQHWYYRTDRASNRRCWRLGPAGLPVQKSAPQAEAQPASGMDARAAAPPGAQEPVSTAPTTEPAEPESDTNVAITAEPVRWLDIAKLPEASPSLQPVPQVVPGAWTQSASADDLAPITSSRASTGVSEPSAPVSNQASASASEPSPPTNNSARKPQRRAAAQPSPLTAPMKSIAEVDHTFALVMFMFAALVIAGPILHYAERRRQREPSNFQVPRWARVVALNAPTPRVLVSLARDSETGKRAAPIPPSPPDQIERLAQALQQVVDRMKTKQEPEPGAVTPPARRVASR
jgi:hypothetical protein